MNLRAPTLEGLTHRQVQIMSMMWVMEDLASVQRFIRALPTRKDQADAATMIELVVADTIEQEQGLELYAEAAEAAISCARCR